MMCGSAVSRSSALRMSPPPRPWLLVLDDSSPTARAPASVISKDRARASRVVSSGREGRCRAQCVASV